MIPHPYSAHCALAVGVRLVPVSRLYSSLQAPSSKFLNCSSRRQRWQRILPVAERTIDQHRSVQQSRGLRGIGAFLALQALFVYLPLMQQFFGTADLLPADIALAVTCGFLILPLISIEKHIRSRLTGRRTDRKT